MLRHAGTVTALAGVVLTALPVAADRNGAAGASVDATPRVRALLQAVHEREHAVRVLEDLRARLADGQSSPAEVRTVTETSDEKAQARDERLESLRLEVSQLQLQFDALRGARLGLTDEGVAAQGPFSAGTTLKVGLDREELSLLAGSTRPASDARRAADAPARQAAPPAPRELGVDAPPLSAVALAAPRAERLRQARASYLAGHHERALALLEGLDPSAEVLHARSRSLERLGRLEEALGSLRLASAEPSLTAPEHAVLAGRVRADLEYVEWTLALRRAGEKAHTKGGGR